MHVFDLCLKDIGGFQDLTIPFERDVTVLVGVNGSGKTTVLEVLAACLRGVFGGGDHLPLSLVRAGAQVATGEVRLGEGGRSGTAQVVGDLSRGRFHEHVQADDRAALGEQLMAVYYPVRRRTSGLSPSGLGAATRHWSPVDARRSALTSETSFEHFAQWYRDLEDAENESFRDGRGAPDPRLEAVRAGLARLLPNLRNLRVRRPRFDASDAHFGGAVRLVVEKGGQTLSLHHLSDGERALIALVGDLARRLALAGSEGEDPLQGTSVVLIDEIEQHLHPRWQRDVLPRLLEVFPNCQFIVTTHSPQVVADVDRRCVRVLEEFELVEAPFTEGRDSNSLLLELFGVAERPRAAAAELDQLAEMIDAERLDEARELLDRLTKKMGRDDATLTGHRVELNFLAGG